MNDKYIIIHSSSANDCDGCPLALACLSPCGLPKGFRYALNPKYKL